MNHWQSSLLNDDHDLASFTCGVDSLDRWLHQQAARAQHSDTARVYVWTSADSAAVVAYYAITPTQVRREEVSRSLSGGVGVIPGYLLAKLALDQSLRGQGLGAQVLLDAIERIVAAADKAAGRLIVVDAIDEHAAAFYTHHDFQPVIGNPLRLVMKVATARKTLGH